MKDKKILVGVYGTLKRGFYNHPLLEQAEYIKNYCIPDGLYCMYDLGSFPAVSVVTEKNKETTPVHIEIYRVDQDTFERLDRLEGYPSFYNRVLIEVDDFHVWMYIMEDSELNYNRFKRVIKSGNYSNR